MAALTESYELGLVGMRSAQKVDGAKGVGGRADRVVGRRPDLGAGGGADGVDVDAVRLVVGPGGAAGASAAVLGAGHEAAALAFRKRQLHPLAARVAAAGAAAEAARAADAEAADAEADAGPSFSCHPSDGQCMLRLIDAHR